MDTYKVGQVRPVTLNKYYLVEKRLKELVPDLDLGDMTRADVQRLINEYPAEIKNYMEALTIRE